MKVKLLHSLSGPDRLHRRGAEIEASDVEAGRLIRSGIAECSAKEDAKRALDAAEKADEEARAKEEADLVAAEVAEKSVVAKKATEELERAKAKAKPAKTESVKK